jgi:hypothetical protein
VGGRFDGQVKEIDSAWLHDGRQVIEFAVKTELPLYIPIGEEGVPADTSLSIARYRIARLRLEFEDRSQNGNSFLLIDEKLSAVEAVTALLRER